MALFQSVTPAASELLLFLIRLVQGFFRVELPDGLLEELFIVAQFLFEASHLHLSSCQNLLLLLQFGVEFCDL